MSKDQTLPPTSTQCAGWGLRALMIRPKILKNIVGIVTYPQQQSLLWSSSVADPSPSTMERGQRHGPGGESVAGKEGREKGVVVSASRVKRKDQKKETSETEKESWRVLNEE